LWLLAGAASGLTLHACKSSTPLASGEEGGSPTTAAVGMTTWIGDTAIFIADGKGFFQEAGLELDLKIFPTVAEAFPSFTAGQLQAVCPVTSEAVSLAAKGVDYRIVAVMDTSTGADGVLARNSIASIANFKGKQVGVQKGGVGHFFLLQILAEAGLSEDDITIVDMTPDAGAAAYQAGNIDIVYSYSPFLEQANDSQKDGRVIYDSSKMPTAIADVYAFSGEFIDANPNAVKAFVSSIFRALDFLQSSPDEALAIAAERLEITAEDLAEQLKGVGLPDLPTNVEMLSNAQSDLYLLKPMNALAEFLKAQNQIDNIPDLSQVLDPQFVKALSEAS
jgi:NitT/TauT family transport system substrate-binding protein